MLKSADKIVTNQSAHLLRLEIIGIIITGRQHVSADHDAAFDFNAETGAAGIGIHVVQMFAGHSQSVTQTIVTRQIGRRFRRRDNIIGGQRVFGMRQRDIDDFRTGGFQHFDPFVPIRRHFGVQPFGTIFGGNTDLQSFDALPQDFCKIRHFAFDGSRILFVVTGHHV